MQDVVDRHNQYRSLHGVPALAHDPSLAASARAWAERCVFQHSGPGENMAMGYGTMAGTNAWYDEVGGGWGAPAPGGRAVYHVLTVAPPCGVWPLPCSWRPQAGMEASAQP
jgi:hypothetical protein